VEREKEVKKMKKMLVLVLALFMVLVLASTSCLAWGAPTVKTVKPGTDLRSIYNQHNGEAMPDWFVGVVYQSAWTKSHGWGADDYNKVKLLVWVPNGTVILVPADARQEGPFAKKFEAGDVIAFRFKDGYGTYAKGTITSFDKAIGVWFDDVMILAKNAAPTQ
jgi:hypothetical protein